MKPGENIKIKNWNNIQKKDRNTGDVFEIESPFHSKEEYYLLVGGLMGNVPIIRSFVDSEKRVKITVSAGLEEYGYLIQIRKLA